MRLNKWIAQHAAYSRRKADELITSGRVSINGKTASVGAQVTDGDSIEIDQKTIASTATSTRILILLNKPIGYVCSRRGQGAPTVYQLIPQEYHSLDIVGRLDKDSAGLLLLTNDGQLTQELTHPKYQKDKLYRVKLSTPLQPAEKKRIEQGIELLDGMSALQLKAIGTDDLWWEVRMHEGRNRQVRRTFAALGRQVQSLERLQFGPYTLDNLASGKIKIIKTKLS